MKRKLDPYTLRYVARWCREDERAYRRAGADISATAIWHMEERISAKAKALTKTPQSARKRNG